MPHRVFVSHSSVDGEVAEQITAFLENNGVQCWIAPRDIPPGADWVEAVIDGIDTASGMVLVVSEASNESPQVRRELERAVSRGLDLVSVVVQPVELSKWMQYYTSTHQRCDASRGGLKRHLPGMLDTFRAPMQAVSADMSNLSHLLEEDIGRLASSIEFEEGRALRLEPGERRRATVLSLHVVPPETAGLGSHPLAGKRIAETLGAMVRRVVEAFGGHLETSDDYRYRSVFGLERALEDHAHRAVSGAVRLFNGIGEMNRVLKARGLVLDFTMGAASGDLEVAQSGSEGPDPAGPPLREADMLAAGPPRNELLVTSELWRICRDRWQFEKAECEGVDDCMRLADYAIVPVEGRLLRVRVPMVGREAELARLERLLHRQTERKVSRNRRGGARHYVVGIRGEAGIGKSRLAHEFRKRCCEGCDDVEALEGRTLSYAQPPNWIWTSLIRGRLGIERDSSIDLEELRRRLSEIDPGGELPDSAPFLADLLGMDPGGAWEAPGREARAVEQRVAVRNLFAALARGRRLVLVLDDLHRIDGASRRMLEFIIGNCDLKTPIVFILIYRSQREDGSSVEFGVLPGYAHLEEIALEPLDRESSAELLEKILASIGPAEAVAEDVRKRLLASARGNPLFMEELVLDLVEEGLLRVEGGTWSMRGAAEGIRIPDGLRNLLQVRLDRLPADWRNVLQTASVLGAEFPLGLYRCFARRVFGRDPETRILDELEGLGLIRCEQTAFGGRYMFESKLLCSSAYESMLESNLQTLHRAAAESMEEYYPEDDELAPGMLMHHWAIAGETSRALKWGIRALEAAADAYENQRVLEMSDRLLEWAGREPEGRERADMEAGIRIARGETLGLLGRREGQERNLYAALELVREYGLEDSHGEIYVILGNFCEMVGRPEEAEGMFGEAERVGRETEEPAYEAHGSMGLAGLDSRAGRSDMALERMERALEIFRGAGMVRGRGNVLVNMGVLHHRLGHVGRAMKCYDSAMKLFRRVGNRKHLATTLVNTGIMQSNQDRMEEAKSSYDRALGIFRTIGYARGEATALINLGIIHREMGRLDEALECFEQALDIEREAGDRSAEAISLINIGSARSQKQEKEAALECYSKALEIAREIGNRRVEGYSLSSVASACRDLGRFEEALDLFDEGMAVLREVGERKATAECSSNLGLLYCKMGRLEDAADCYRASAETIGDIGAGRYDSEVTVDLRDTLLARGCPKEDVPLPDHWERG